MKRLLVLFVSLGLFAAACGSDGAETETGADGDSDVVASEAVDDEEADGTAEPATDSTESSADSDGSDDPAAGSDSNGDGGDADGGDALSASEIEELLAATAEQTSGRFEAIMEMTGGAGSELPGTVVIEFSGAFDNATQASELMIDMGGVVEAALAADPETADDPDAAAGMAMMEAFFEDPMQVITIGDRSWVKWSLMGMFGVGDKWLEGEADSATEGFGFDANGPEDMLGGFAESGQSVEFVGEDEIRGVTAAHYRSELDPATMTAEQRAAFGDDLPDNGRYVLHIWVADGLVHRFQIEVSDLEQTVENELESMTMTYDLFDHGAAIEITAPPPDQVVTEAELGFDLDDFNPAGG